MATINRFAAILRAKQPFIDWVNAQPEATKKYSAEEVREEPVVYLIPQHETNMEAMAWIFDEFDYFFEDQLEAWWTDEGGWPQDRTAEMFKKWFEVEVFSIVEDAVDERLKHDS